MCIGFSTIGQRCDDKCIHVEVNSDSFYKVYSLKEEERACRQVQKEQASMWRAEHFTKRAPSPEIFGRTLVSMTSLIMMIQRTILWFTLSQLLWSTTFASQYLHGRPNACPENHQMWRQFIPKHNDTGFDKGDWLQSSRTIPLSFGHRHSTEIESSTHFLRFVLDVTIMHCI